MAGDFVGNCGGLGCYFGGGGRKNAGKAVGSCKGVCISRMWVIYSYVYAMELYIIKIQLNEYKHWLTSMHYCNLIILLIIQQLCHQLV